MVELAKHGTSYSNAVIPVISTSLRSPNVYGFDAAVSLICTEFVVQNNCVNSQ
jgi:hypothetical protein